jgi:hypothetical protein
VEVLTITVRGEQFDPSGLAETIAELLHLPKTAREPWTVDVTWDVADGQGPCPVGYWQSLHGSS